MSLKDNNRKLNQTNEKIGSGESSLGCKTRVMVKKKKKKQRIRTNKRVSISCLVQKKKKKKTDYNRSICGQEKLLAVTENFC